jgi:two-component system, chemotaxis family, chemotaxis protein CheY
VHSICRSNKFAMRHAGSGERNLKQGVLLSIDFSPREQSYFELSPSKILLVDDDPDVRSLTRTFLEHEGYGVFSSGDAERAAQIFRSVPEVDLLVTDLYMPGRSGIELAHELKALKGELSVLMISGGLVDSAQKAKLEEEGWNFLAKPFRLTELLSAVHRILAPREARRWKGAR